jgi:hypothetical protein
MAVSVISPAPAGPLGQPDIGYTPNPETYRARVERRLAKENLSRTLPDGFPQQLKSELVWDGATVSAEYEWSYQLTEQDLEEVHQALEHFRGMLHFLLRAGKMVQELTTADRSWYSPRTNLSRDLPPAQTSHHAP